MEKTLEHSFTKLIDKNFEDISEELQLEKLEKEEGLDGYYCEIKDRGVLLTFDETKKLISINLISNSYMLAFGDYCDHFKQFSENLPFGLSWGVSEDAVLLILGQPQYIGGGIDDADIPRWNKYIFENCSLHFQYPRFAKLEMVTIASLSLESYLNSVE